MHAEICDGFSCRHAYSRRVCERTTEMKNKHLHVHTCGQWARGCEVCTLSRPACNSSTLPYSKSVCTHLLLPATTTVETVQTKLCACVTAFV